MTPKTLTAAALILALMPTMGLARDAGNRPQMPEFDFAAADADASGGISYPEFTAYLRAQMETRRAEALAARADRLIDAGDADGDTVLTRDELIGGMATLGDQRRMQMLEQRGAREGERRGERGEMRGERGDERGERGGMRSEMRGERGDERGERGGMRGHGRGSDHGMRGHGGEQGERFGRGMDPERMANRLFDRIDSDNDGQINADELQTAQARMHERMERRQERRDDR